MDKQKLELIDLIMKTNCPTKLNMVKELLSGIENNNVEVPVHETPSEKQRFDYHVDLLKNVFEGKTTEPAEIDEIVSARNIEPKNDTQHKMPNGFSVNGIDLGSFMKDGLGTFLSQDSDFLESMNSEIEKVASLFKSNMNDVLEIYEKYGDDPMKVANKMNELYEKVNSKNTQSQASTLELEPIAQSSKFNTIHNPRVTNLLVKFESIFLDNPFTNDEISEISANTRGNNKESFNNMVNFIMKKYNDSPISFIKQLVSDTASAFEISFEYVNTQVSAVNSKQNVATFKINDIEYVVVYKNSFTKTRETFDFMIANFVE